MTFTIKHKGSSRYGVVDENGNWFDDFLGTKEEAEAKVLQLNAEQVAPNAEQLPPSIDEVTPNETQTPSDEPFKGIVTGSDDDITASLVDQVLEPSEIQEDYETKKQENGVKEVAHPTASRAHPRFVLTEKGLVKK